MDIRQKAMEAHKNWRGKIEIKCRAEVSDKDDLSIAYTPGVAEPCLAIQKEPELSFELTRRWNTVAVITDGTAVLGLGDIGPEAGMPVMEGKCALFKAFGDVDAIPLCVRSKDTDEIVKAVSLFAGSFGGINLEDIAAPRCFEIERRLKEECDIPVFHDDQHGTAVVVLAGLKNALKLVGKSLSSAAIVINGAGSAGTAIAKLILKAGAGELIICDREGALTADSSYENPAFAELAEITNPKRKCGALRDVIKGADVFIGVSGPSMLTADMIKDMAEEPVVFAMANPVPEIYPDEAKAAGARVACSGRSDFPNQINNVLAFPGIFRGALDVRASDITEGMKLAAADAIAGIIADDELSEEYIIPAAFDKRVCPAIAEAVAQAARRDNVAMA